MKKLLLIALIGAMVMTSVPISASASPSASESLISKVFDFGDAGVCDGCIGVSASDGYSKEKGYGFAYTDKVENVPASGEGALSDAVRFKTGDGKHTFNVDLPVGVYQIEVTTGDVESTTIFAEGFRQLLFMTGSNAVDSFTIPITDGQLNLYASAGRSGTPFSISKVEIRQVSTDTTTKPTIWTCGDSTVASYYNVTDEDTHGWGQYLADYVDTDTYMVRNYSVSGMDATTLVNKDRKYFDTIEHYGKSGDILVLSLGINDYREAYNNNNENPDPTEYVTAMTEMVRRAKAKGIRVYLTKQHGDVYDCTVYPLPQKKWFSDEIDTIAQEEQVEVLDLYSSWLIFCLESPYRLAKGYYSSGVHTNLAGAKKMAEIVSKLLFPVVQQTEIDTTDYSQFDNPLTVVYQTEVSGKPVANPHKGFVMTVYKPHQFENTNPYGIGGSKENHAWDVVTICNGEHKWKDINPEKGVYNWEEIDNMLAACEKHGMTYGIRILPYSLLSSSIANVESVRDFIPQWVYDSGAQKEEVTLKENPSVKIEVPVWDDPIYLQACKDFATALAKHYDGDPRVEFIDIRTFGNWGEWHFSQVNGSEMPSVEIQKDMLKHYKDAFQNTLVVALSSVEGEVYEYALDIGVAKRDNGLISTVNREWSLRPSYKANVPVLADNYAPYSMMLDNSSDSGLLVWTPTRFRECIEIPHLSIMALDQDSECSYQFYKEQKELIDEMVNRIGYNFTVTSAKRNGNKLLVKMKNTGVAPCYFDISLCAELTDENGNKLESFGEPISIEKGTFHDEQEKTFIFEYNGAVADDAIISLAMYDIGNPLVAGKNPTVKFDNKNAFSTNRLQLIKESSYYSVADEYVYYTSYQGYDFYRHINNGNTRCYDATTGAEVYNAFKCDGTYTYYFQYDRTAMRDRLTYHPDGKHIIYFDKDGHEVFSDYGHITTSIAGDKVDDYCFFDVYGYMYVDVMTYDITGTKIYYANPYGVLEHTGWFMFSDGGYGYANGDMSLMTDQHTYDWNGNLVYMEADGHIRGTGDGRNLWPVSSL